MSLGRERRGLLSWVPEGSGRGGRPSALGSRPHPEPSPNASPLAPRFLLSGSFFGLNLMPLSQFPIWKRDPGLPALGPFLTNTGAACLSFRGPWGPPCWAVFCHLVITTLSQILSIFC